MRSLDYPRLGQVRERSGPLFDHLLHGAAEETELVAVRVGEDNPAHIRVLTDIDSPGAEALKPDNLGIEASTVSSQVEVLGDGPEVQLSVRVPEGLRSAVTATAVAQEMTVTAFVHRALLRAVIEASDSFAGLAADLSRKIRAELRSTIEDGTYRKASADVEREEAWS